MSAITHFGLKPALTSREVFIYVPRLLSIIVFILGCTGLIAVMVFDKLYWGTNILAEGWPDFSPGHIVRSIIIFFSTLAMLWSFISSNTNIFEY